MMVLFTLVAISLLLCSTTSHAAFVPVPRLARLSVKRSVASSIRPENVTSSFPTKDTTDDDVLLDESQFLQDMEREIDAVDKLNLYQTNPTENMLLKPEAASAAQVASHVQSPYPEHAAKMQELALKAELISQKYDAPIEVHKKSVTTVSSNTDATAAFLLLGITVAAVTLADPNVVTDQLASVIDSLEQALQVDLSALDLSALDLSSFDLSRAFDLSSITSSLMQARDLILTQASTFGDNVLVQAHHAEDIMTTQLLALQEFVAKIDMEQFLQWLRELEAMLVTKLSSSPVVQQFALNLENLKNDMNHGAQLLMDAKTWSIDASALVARFQEAQHDLLSKASSSTFQLPALPTLAQISDNAVHALLGKAYKLDGFVQAMQEQVAKNTANLEQAKIGMQNAMQSSHVQMQEMMRDASNQVGHLQAAMMSQSASSIDLDGLQQAVVGRIQDTQENVLTKLTSIQVPRSSMPLEDIMQRALDDTVSSIKVPHFDLQAIKEEAFQGMPQFDLDSAMQGWVDRVQDAQATLVAKANSVELPQLEDMLQDFQFRMQAFQNQEGTRALGNNLVSIKDDMVKMVSSVNDISITLPKLEPVNFDVPTLPKIESSFNFDVSTFPQLDSSVDVRGVLSDFMTSLAPTGTTTTTIPQESLLETLQVDGAIGL